jgi:hypothetical protein
MQKGAQLSSLRDMKSNYSDALWNKRVEVEPFLHFFMRKKRGSVQPR